MKAGQLRHRITLQTLTVGQDEIGQPVTTWVDTIANLPANVGYLSGIGTIKSGADVSISKASIRIRSLAVNAGQRVIHEGVVFDIKNVIPDSRRVFVDLVCQVVS